MNCWSTVGCTEIVLGLVGEGCFVVSDRMLSMLVEPLDMLCAEAVDALVPRAGDLKPDDLSPFCLIRIFKKLNLCHLDRQVATVGESLPETLPPCFVLKMFSSLVIQLLGVFHKVHNSLLFRVHQVDVGHVPFLVS